MTIVTGSEHLASQPAKEALGRPSDAAMRARRLLRVGLLAGHGTTLLCIGLFALTHGALGALSAALGGALVILFYTVGQAIQIRYCDIAPRDLMRISVASYIARVSFLGALLALYLRFADAAHQLAATPLAVTVIGTVVTWLASQALVLSRMRIPRFDEPVEQPGRGVAR